eukprot:334597-Hanusia_phi.AAC.1
MLVLADAEQFLTASHNLMGPRPDISLATRELLRNLGTMFGAFVPVQCHRQAEPNTAIARDRELCCST